MGYVCILDISVCVCVFSLCVYAFILQSLQRTFCLYLDKYL